MNTLSRRHILAAAAALAFAPLRHASAQPGTSRDIAIGQSSTLSGSQAPTFLEINQGISGAFADINAEGGIGGARLRLISLDDEGIPEKATANAKRLAEDERVTAFLGCGGTGSVLGVLPVVTASGIPLVAPGTGSDAVRAFHPLVFHTRASYAQEIDKIVQHLTTIRLSRCAVILSGGAFGKFAENAFLSSALRHKLDTHALFALGATEADGSALIPKVLEWAPTSVLFLSVGANTIPFVQELRRASKAQFLTMSLLGTTRILTAIGTASQGFVVSQVAPQPTHPTAPVALAFRASMKRLGVTHPTHQMLEGYIGARVLIEGLRRSANSGGRLKLATALDSVKRIPLGGYEVNYSSGSHDGSSFVDLALYTGSRFVR